MKVFSIWTLILSLLAASGCKKKEEAAAPVTVNGEKIELPVIPVKKEQADPQKQASDREVQGALSQAMYNIRYENYASARANLDQIAANPNLSAEQKQSIAKAMEQLAQAIKANPRAAH
jgi:hypothetical protein